jgi:UDP-N-acetylmuramoyl-L-alanyl-D-glutamate--2,6-diaminopimelate ligase
MSAAPNISMLLAQLPQPVGHITSDSRLVRPGSVFVAYPGSLIDGRDFIDTAILAGAHAVLVEARGWTQRALPVPCIAVENLRRWYAMIVDAARQFPSKKLRLIGITGTNGKTSTATWIAQALEHMGQGCGVIGTLGAGRLVDHTALKTVGNTTPDASIVVDHLADFVKTGARAAVMEVSSHALDQERVHGLQFECAVFTNLTRDHLDYHRTMEAYRDAKAKLFAFASLRYVILNADDPYSAALPVSPGVRVVRYGLRAGEVIPQHLHIHRDGIAMTVQSPWGDITVKVGVLGAFNVSNVLAVIATLGAYGLTATQIGAAVNHITPVAGRMQRVVCTSAQPNVSVVVDYAHTPDALEKALTTLRSLSGGGALHVVFGCGGNRDAGKRPLMGSLAASLADCVWLTSDNPRHESPTAIINQIASGISDSLRDKVRIVEDRALAIHSAIASAKSNDMVLIAGKGHETYQEINGIRSDFDDVAIARAALC